MTAEERLDKRIAWIVAEQKYGRDTVSRVLALARNELLKTMEAQAAEAHADERKKLVAMLRGAKLSHVGSDTLIDELADLLEHAP